MSVRLNGKFALHAGLVLGCVLILSAPARAFDEDDMPDTKFLKGLMGGLGLSKDGSAGIEYRERSPLVIPPSRSLPSPETVNAASRPNWPVDPEIKAEKERKTKAKSAKLAPGKTGDPWIDDGRPISREELNRGTSAAATRDGGAMSAEDSSRWFLPDKLGVPKGFFGFLGKADESAKFTGEPPRASLTDPPSGYQVPSPNQPYGLGKSNEQAKPKDYLTEHGTQRPN